MSEPEATFLRFVFPHELMDDLVHEAKHLTWEHYCEHALLALENGRRILVRGLAYGIELERSLANDPFGRPANHLYVNVDNEWLWVVKLIFHTHPKPTGPSDDDLIILDILGQSSSMLYEIFGPIEGTKIRPKRK